MALLSAIPNILLIVLGFGFLIFVHELGHFAAAKWAGIRTEGFAIGMGPVALAWRKGVGLTIGSTHRRVVEKAGLGAHQLSESQLAAHGLGETEYSLRWLPIGGFVRMLGQDDLDPSRTSGDPRSYNRCSIGKRMVVVSAGVVANLITAAILFIIAFMVGVELEAPVVGDVDPKMPAARAIAANAAALGVSESGLRPGDRVLRIDGDDVETFADIQIASAFAAPQTSLQLEVARPGVETPLIFDIDPEKDRLTGLLGLGIFPGASTRLAEEDASETMAAFLDQTGLAAAGVEPGMALLTAAGRPASTYRELAARAAEADGAPVETTWAAPGATAEPIRFLMPTQPSMTLYQQREADADFGLLGLVPLKRVLAVDESSLNRDVLRAGDVFLRVGRADYPRPSQLLGTLRENKGKAIPLVLLRDGARVEVSARLSREGRLGIRIEDALDVPITAEPIGDYARRADDGVETLDVRTPVASDPLQRPLGGSRILSAAGRPIESWGDLRSAARDAALTGAASMEMVILAPTPEAEPSSIELALADHDRADLVALTWAPVLPEFLFDPVTTVRHADGNPIIAVWMGVEETHKLVMMTYLTIDRLVRRTVGIEQLRGPVGIVDLGSRIIPKGFIFFLFFLGMISVNLAVINFLPLPIVDGGLFLFLVYEKIKKRPPSIAFQNAATLAGLALIGTVFIVVTWNDIARLIG